MHTIYWDWVGMQTMQSVLQLQETLFHKCYHGERKNFLIFAEHPHCFVYTHKSIESQLRVPFDIFKKLSLPIFKLNHGGEATYHGPGQLVAYWILDLASLHFDLLEFFHSLGVATIDFLKTLGLTASIHSSLEFLKQRPEASGAWIDGVRKIKSRGLRVARAWDGAIVTTFGFALNVSTDLSYFSYIFPCGLDIEMTSLEKELGHSVSVEEVISPLLRSFRKIYAPREIVFENVNLKPSRCIEDGF